MSEEDSKSSRSIVNANWQTFAKAVIALSKSARIACEELETLIEREGGMGLHVLRLERARDRAAAVARIAELYEQEGDDE